MKGSAWGGGRKGGCLHRMVGQVELTFVLLEWDIIVRHTGRDPKIFGRFNDYFIPDDMS